MADFEAWLVFLILVVNVVLAKFNGKEHLRHRAVSLRQHGFLVRYVTDVRKIIIITGLLTYLLRSALE